MDAGKNTLHRAVFLATARLSCFLACIDYVLNV